MMLSFNDKLVTNWATQKCGEKATHVRIHNNTHIHNNARFKLYPWIMSNPKLTEVMLGLSTFLTLFVIYIYITLVFDQI